MSTQYSLCFLIHCLSSAVVPSKMFYAYSRSNVSHIYNAQTRYIYLTSMYVSIIQLYLSRSRRKCSVSFPCGEQKIKWKTSIQFWHIAFIILLCLWDLVEWKKASSISIWKCDKKFNNSIDSNLQHRILVWFFKNECIRYDTFYVMGLDRLDIGHVDNVII